jgi:hypothetical protein
MSAKAHLVEEFSFTGEEVGASGGQALAKVQSLIDTAPIGRLFDAIATLSELSVATAQQLEMASAALARNDLRAAAAAAAQARLISAGLKSTDQATPFYLRRKM